MNEVNKSSEWGNGGMNEWSTADREDFVEL